MGDISHMASAGGGIQEELEADATGRDRVCGWLSVGCRVSGLGSRGRVGLVTPTPNGHLPALFGGPRPILRIYNWGEWIFDFSVVRWIGQLE
jgi:hypothetical protein